MSTTQRERLDFVLSSFELTAKQAAEVRRRRHGNTRAANYHIQRNRLRGPLEGALPIRLIHADDFIMDVVDLNKPYRRRIPRVAGPDKKNPRWETGELIQRFNSYANICD